VLGRNVIRCLVAGLTLVVAGALPAGASEETSPEPIVDGGPVAIEDAPWTVAVLLAGNGSAAKRQVCGGTLVQRQWVLTAANCVAGRRPSELRVVVNATTLGAVEPSAELRLSRVVVHPDYNPVQGTADVAMLKLRSPQSTVTTIALNDDAAVPASGEDLAVFGWGASTDGKQPSTLRGAIVQNLETAGGLCGPYSGTEYNSLANVCAGYADGAAATCAGDNGGPLVATQRGGARILVGVTGATDRCGDPGYPGVYQRVSTYEGWVFATIGTPDLSVGQAVVVEGDTDTRTVRVPVWLSHATSRTVRVRWQVTPFTAQANDITGDLTGELEIAPGETQAYIPVTVVGDTIPEQTEQVAVRVTSLQNAKRLKRSGRLRINDDDVVGSGGAVRLGVGSVTSGGGLGVRLPVTLSRPVDHKVTVTLVVVAKGQTIETVNVSFAAGDVDRPVPIVLPTTGGYRVRATVVPPGVEAPVDQGTILVK